MPNKIALLEEAEKRVLRDVKTPLKTHMVKIPRNFLETKDISSPKNKNGKTWDISTISFTNLEKEKPICVLVHGWGAGKGIYVQSFDDLASVYEVHAIDLLGWGRSSRPCYKYGDDPSKVQRWWVESLEAWRVAMGIEKFTLVGHSMGGFVAASYALKYKQHLDKLVLVSPIGLQGFRTPDFSISFAQSILISSVWSLTPQRIVSMLPRKRTISYLSRQRVDLLEAFPYTDRTIMHYFYYLAVQSPISGEAAFKRLGTPFKGWHLPLKDELHNLGDLPVVLMYGEDDWMDPSFAVYELKAKILPQAKVYILPDSGHHLYAEKWMEFNEIVINGEKAYPGCWIREFNPAVDPLKK
ncbi:424_t:CDS:2, partial [Paraglomus occultum]